MFSRWFWKRWLTPEIRRNCAFVNFTNVANAIKAIEGIKGNLEYASLRIAHGKDRCANPPRSGPQGGARRTPSGGVGVGLNASASGGMGVGGGVGGGGGIGNGNSNGVDDDGEVFGTDAVFVNADGEVEERPIGVVGMLGKGGDMVVDDMGVVMGV